MEQKKPTNAQLTRRIERAIMHIDRTKDTQEIYFSDKGLRLIVNEDFAIIETVHHRHVFANYTANGVSRPYLYTKRLVEMALANDCVTPKGHSFSQLADVLKAKEDKTEYNIFWYIDKWLFNIFQPLYSIGESESESFLVYESFLHNLARNEIMLSERTEDITNKQFIDKICEHIKDYTKELDERVLFPKKTDEERMKENIEATQELEANEQIANSTNSNGSQD